MAKRTPREERLLNPDGRRHFRKTYSMGEVKAGALVVAGLAAILGWVLWKGANPDPSLVAEGVELGLEVNQTVVETQGVGLGEPRGEGNAAQEGSPTTGSGEEGVLERGVVPAGLALSGWTEDPVRRFDWDNLYIKINGREDYYKSFGFKQLFVTTLEREDNEARTVDIELYDMGEPANALGAYAGERQPDVEAESSPSGLSHLARNGYFMTQGRYYLRAIGSDEEPETIKQIQHVAKVFRDNLPAEDLPWGFRLLGGIKGVKADKIAYYKENAFSFSFGTNVYAAKTGPGETEVFVTPSAAASALAEKYQKGFSQFGSSVKGSISWSKDQFLGELAGSKAAGSWVIGVRAAPDQKAAERALEQIEQVVKQAPPALAKEAQSAAPAPPDTSPQEDYDTASPPEEY